MGGSFDDLKKLSSARKASVDSARPRLRKSTTENDDDLKDDDEDALKEEEEEEEFEFNEHHALTLTGLSGKRLKRELSRHQLFQGLEDTQSPETTPGGTLTMESAQTLAAETDLIRDAKVVSGAGGRDEYLYQQQKVEEESGSHGNNNNNNNASGNGGGGGGIKHAPSLAQIFGTANASGNNSSSPAGMERSSSPSLSPQHKQMLREYTMNKNKEQLSNNNNNNNSNNNNNNEKNKSSATNLQHANTLSGASSKFLAEEIRHMRDDPSLDKKTKTKKSKSTTIKEGEELMVMAPDGTTKKKKNAKEVDEVLDQGQRRLALRSVQRTTEDLLLISDALKTKEATLGSLPTRLGKGLELIKDNITRIHRSEGLLSRKKVAMGRVNRYELLRGAFGGGEDGRSEKGESEAGEDLYAKFTPRKLKVKSKKKLIVMAILTGIALVLLCCTTVFVKQYEEDYVLLVAPALSHEIVELHEHAEISKKHISHASKGMMEVKMGASECHAHHTTDVPVYYLHSQIRQGDVVLAALADIQLHDLGSSDDPTGAHREGEEEEEEEGVNHNNNSGGYRRALLSASAGGPGPSVEKMSYTILSNYKKSNGDVYITVSTNCPENVSVRATIRDVGLVGIGQQWIALVLLIGVFGLIIVEVIHRTLVAFLGAAAVLYVLALEHRFPSVAKIIQWMDHETLALLWGMMVIVALLARSGVFEFLSVRLIELSRCDMWRLTWMLMLFDCILSAFLDNVTTMLLLAPVIISLCKALKIDPRPLLLPLALFGNIGGAATMIGDPPNIIVGNALKEYIDFNDFLQIMAPGVVLTVPVVLVFVRWHYGKEFYSQKLVVDLEKMKRDYPIRDMPLLIRSGIVLCFVIVLFFLHPVIHFSPSYAALFGAIAVLLTGPEHDFEHALEKVEWDSLLFFAGLFVFTEGVAELGLLREISDALSALIEMVPVEKRSQVAIVLVQIVAAVASAFVDNIPFTTTMLPVIVQIAENVEGVHIKGLGWALCFGADFGGMGTLIGASANIVMAGIAHEAGFHVTFGQFFKIGFPAMWISLVISVCYLCMMEGAGALK
jgi:Na+/H+ antiporter NhaD/arsenite permease-like protein